MSAASIETVGVVGAGTMGVGIAAISCLGGSRTLIHDPVPDALEAASARVRSALSKGAGKGWTDEEAERAGGLLSAVAGIDGLSACDLVIEAAPEDLSLKQELFAALAAACGTGTAAIRWEYDPRTP